MVLRKWHGSTQQQALAVAYQARTCWSCWQGHRSQSGSSLGNQVAVEVCQRRRADTSSAVKHFSGPVSWELCQCTSSCFPSSVSSPRAASRQLVRGLCAACKSCVSCVASVRTAANDPTKLGRYRSRTKFHSILLQPVTSVVEELIFASSIRVFFPKQHLGHRPA